MPRILKKTKLLSAFVFITLANAKADSRPKPKPPVPLPSSMVSFGDSITAGALAGLSRTAFYNPFHLLKIFSTLAEMAFKWDVYAAIQDRHLSWATGLSSDFAVKSHAHRLAYLHTKAGTQMSAGSVSWSGDSSFDLTRQVNATLAWSKSHVADGGPEYVTIMIGANDVCGDSVNEMSSDRDYYNNVDTAISRLVSANPKTRIMVSALPDINSLNGIANRSRLLGFGPYARCEDIWRKTNLCYTLTGRLPGSLDEHIVGEKIDNINRMLGEITTRINRQTRKQTVIFAQHTYEKKLSDKDLSIDCFHPNQKGQNIIAATTWEDSFWRENWNEDEYDRYVVKIKSERARRNPILNPRFRR